MDQEYLVFKIAMKNGLTKEHIGHVINNDAFIKMINAIQKHSNETLKEPQTATLWIFYIEYIYIVKEFLVAEKICNWYLYLQGVMKMINFFEASGHRNYAKCSRLYLQEMLSLSDTNP